MSILEDIRDRIIEITDTLVTERSEDAKSALWTPTIIDSGELPLFTNHWGATTSNELVDNQYYDTVRNWTVKCVMEKAGIGQYSTNENRMAEWIASFRKTMVRKPQLQDSTQSGLKHVRRAVITGDDGGTVSPYPDGGSENFYIITFTLSIAYMEVCQ